MKKIIRSSKTMILKTIFLCLSLFLVHGQGNSTEPKLQIVNGQVADSKEGTFTVFIKEVAPIKGTTREVVNTCGGTLINLSTVLTAAHCFDSRTEYFRTDKNPGEAVTIRYGTHDRKARQFHDRTAQRIILHPDYNENTDENDIAIIKLNKKVSRDVVKKRIGIAELPKANQIQYNAGTKATVYGWGRTREDGKGKESKLLMKTTLEMVKVEKSTIIWAKGQNSATCTGDSGGPLVFNGNILIGIDSIGIKNTGDLPCQVNKITEFTKVESYMDWIKSNS